jgi:deoxyinosine 3'endonuclease (endonuclease V)
MQRANSNPFGNAAHFPSSCDAFFSRSACCTVSIMQAKIKPEKRDAVASPCRIPYCATRLFLQEIEEDAYLP